MAGPGVRPSSHRGLGTSGGRARHVADPASCLQARHIAAIEPQPRGAGAGMIPADARRAIARSGRHLTGGFARRGPYLPGGPAKVSRLPRGDAFQLEDGRTPVDRGWSRRARAGDGPSRSPAGRVEGSPPGRAQSFRPTTSRKRLWHHRLPAMAAAAGSGCRPRSRGGPGPIPAASRGGRAHRCRTTICNTPIPGCARGRARRSGLLPSDGGLNAYRMPSTNGPAPFRLAAPRMSCTGTVDGDAAGGLRRARAVGGSGPREILAMGDRRLARRRGCGPARPWQRANLARCAGSGSRDRARRPRRGAPARRPKTVWAGRAETISSSCCLEPSWAQRGGRRESRARRQPLRPCATRLSRVAHCQIDRSSPARVPPRFLEAG
jgi:hypothetical protein